MSEDNQKKLKDLIQLDIDAVEAYDHAIEKIDASHVKEALRSFQLDHKRHIDQLSDALKSMGGEPPENKPDFKGYLIKGMTALRSAMGTKGALKAMDQNEETTTSNYKDCMEHDFGSEQVNDLIRKGYEDERRHKTYIEGALKAISEDRLDTYNLQDPKKFDGQQPVARAY